MENQIDLKDKSPIELKAIAYDLGVMINDYRNMLNIVNQEIMERAKQTAQSNGQAAHEARIPSNDLKKVD